MLPILIYAGMTAHFAVNIPFWDDYEIVLAFLNRWNGSLPMLFEQHNEHRPVITRCVALALDGLFSGVDVRWLILVGNTGLVLLFVVVSRMADYAEGGLTRIVPVALLMFSLQNWENMTWAIASIQNYWVIVFSILSICWLLEPDWLRFAGGLVLGVLASFTSGNGIIPFMVVGLWYAFVIATRSVPEQSSVDSVVRLLAILGVAAVVWALYFHGYVSPVQHTDLGTALSHPLRTAWYFFAFLGSYVVVPPVGLPAAAPVGVATFLLFPVLIVRGRWRWFPAPYLALLFIFGSAGMAALTRSDFGIEQAVTSRYRVLPLLAVSLLWLEAYATDLWTIRSRRWLPHVAALAGVILFIGSLSFFTSLARRQVNLVNGMALFRRGDIGALAHGSPSRAAAVLRDPLTPEHFRIAP